jgi:hypothetical protein
MPTPDKVTVNGVDYFPVPAKSDEVKILVLSGRWNLVGRYCKDGVDHVLTDAKVIRYWGTPDGGGLGLLAAEGPTSKTRLDPAGTVRAHELTTVMVMDASTEAWAAVL